MTEIPKRKTALARKLRKALTEPAWLLWKRLKARSDDLVFKRQHAFGPYILDFFCFRAKLVIEVDGAIHSDNERAEKDAIRDTWLLSQALEVYRIPAAEVYRNVGGVADAVRLLALARVKSQK